MWGANNFDLNCICVAYIHAPLSETLVGVHKETPTHILSCIKYTSIFKQHIISSHTQQQLSKEVDTFPILIVCVSVRVCVHLHHSPDPCTYIISSKPSTFSLYPGAKEGISGANGLLPLPSLPAGRNCGRSFLAPKWRSIDVWSCQLPPGAGGTGQIRSSDLAAVCRYSFIQAHIPKTEQRSEKGQWRLHLRSRFSF